MKKVLFTACEMTVNIPRIIGGFIVWCLIVMPIIGGTPSNYFEDIFKEKG